MSLNPGDDGDDPVATQYADWAYPEPISDLAAWSAAGGYDLEDPAWKHWSYWPATGYPQQPRILVAGCGANQAASIAYHNPKATVLGIDISGPGLEHEARLKQRHGLDNLELRRLAIEDAGAIDRSFDFISCIGVLHHLDDPERGLNALADRLSLEGVLAVMVYGTHFRRGVYMLQELFRTLELGQGAHDLEVVRSVLANLSAAHPASQYIKAAPDLRFDTGLVDTFLHARDRAYTVRQCLDLATRAGLVFQGWQENIRYYPEGYLANDATLLDRFRDLDDVTAWSAMELFLGTIGRHEFFLCRPDRPVESYRLTFDGDAFLDYIPVSRVDEVVPASDSDRPRPAARRKGGPEIALNADQVRLFDHMDGHNSVRSCIEKSGFGGDEAQQREFARVFVRSLWRIGYIFLRLPG